MTQANRTAHSFGDTAANVGILALLQSNGFMKKLPTPLKSAFASLAAALFRMILTPVDTLKTTLQAQGTKKGMAVLKQRVRLYVICQRSAGLTFPTDQSIRPRHVILRRMGDRLRDVRRALSRTHASITSLSRPFAYSVHV